MVVLVDLDDVDSKDALPPPPHTAADDGRPNPNINGFSAALSCYPIVSQLARQLDLNTLHSLSRTCRQFRANLLEYRDQLIRHTLHCSSDRDGNGASPPPRQGYGRQARCARDMVAECQRCGLVVCRNCTVKPPPVPLLRARHRRLCRTCERAPLALLTATPRPRAPSDASTASSPPASPDLPPSNPHDHDTTSTPQPRAFTSPAFERTPCICDSTVWLCQPCGQHLKNADVMYVRAWTWRTRYSHYLGGVGTGAGEGNEGVECGRGARCLAAHVVEHEVDCNPGAVLNGSSSGSGAYANGGFENGSSGSSGSPDRWTGTSYHAQEIEGIGGIVKMKLKKQVRVGACVKVYEDERDKSIRWLEREVAGKLRSWCSWCDRVVLGSKDDDPAVEGLRLG